MNSFNKNTPISLSCLRPARRLLSLNASFQLTPLLQRLKLTFNLNGCQKTPSYSASHSLPVSCSGGHFLPTIRLSTDLPWLIFILYSSFADACTLIPFNH